jgi:anti-sigma regulatory factor (Ser/Thr protein kinase)
MSAAPQEMRSREFAGTIAGAGDAEAWVVSQTGQLGLAEDARFAINLCVEELFLNAVQHGKANHATVSLWTEPDGVRVEFIDDGSAFDPTGAPARRDEELSGEFRIGGHGARLVREFSRRMTYRRTEGRNRLLLEFATN